MLQKQNVALFASGTGTNVSNILEYAQENSLSLNFSCVITDKSDAKVQQVADHFKIPCFVMPYRHNSKEEYELELLETLKEYNITWAFLCGYMRILGTTLLKYFYDEQLEQNRIINVHPSFLPEFPGKDSYERAFEEDCKESGVTIHFVDSGIDTGKVLIQERLPKVENEDFQQFKNRGQKLEYKLYRQVVKKISDYQQGGILWTK